jgi:hypothetical protein
MLANIGKASTCHTKRKKTEREGIQGRCNQTGLKPSENLYAPVIFSKRKQQKENTLLVVFLALFTIHLWVLVALRRPHYTQKPPCSRYSDLCKIS